jgi:serine/threonine protein kinase
VTSDAMRRSMPPLEAGRVLEEKFEICGILGEGVSGIVYDARPLTSDAPERVALKVLHPHLWGDEQIRGRFTREVAILRRLEGNHLCPILDSGEVVDPRSGQSLLYMALPKIDGPSLERLVAAEGPLPIERIIDVALQICGALADAHRQGVIHRDLKPANVLMRGGTHAVVVDFGMAKIVTGPGGTGTTALTSHNMVFGTPEYMAPEQARGDELDARCDVYAVGIILYELLAGKVPFTGPSPLNVLTAHMTVDAEPLRERVPERGVSVALDRVVQYALMKSPEQRYTGAAALATALAHARIAPDDGSAVRPERVDSQEDQRADPHAATIPSPIPLAGLSSPPSSAKASDSSRSQKPPSLPSRTSSPQATPPPVAPPAPSWLDGPRWTLVWLIATAIGVAVGVWLSLRS